VAKLSLDNRSDCAFFGVYDGHGGAQVARFCAKYMPDQLISMPEFRNGKIADALKATYLAIDDKLRQPNNAEILNQLKAKSANEGSSNFGAITIVDSSEAEVVQGAANCASPGRLSASVSVVQCHTLFSLGVPAQELSFPHRPAIPSPHLYRLRRRTIRRACCWMHRCCCHC
jgi:Protein phosphatase 2C